MKFGICQWSLPLEGPYACTVAQRLGLEGIQLDMGTWERGLALSRPAVREAWLEMAGQTGIQFPSIATTLADYFDLTAPDGSEDRTIVLHAFDKAVEAAVHMGVGMIMTPTFEKSAVRNEEEFGQLVSFLQYACDRTGEHGLTMATENPLSAADTLRLFREVDRANLRLYFDTQNYFLHLDADSAALIRELHGLFGDQLHVKDGRNKDLSGALLGEGDSGFAASATALHEVGYDGWIILENYYDREPLRAEDDDPEELIRRDLAIARETFAPAR
jgi:sugar phosphate isomerase/epimerase